MRISDLVRVVSDALDVNPHLIIGSCRTDPVMKARRIVCFIAYHDMGYVQQRIARVLGRSSHVAIASAINTLERDVIKDLDTAEIVLKIRKRVKQLDGMQNGSRQDDSASSSVSRQSNRLFS